MAENQATAASSPVALSIESAPVVTASSQAFGTIIRSGFLQKKGDDKSGLGLGDIGASLGIWNAWRKRYFVLTPDSLTYFDNKASDGENGVNKKGEIIISNIKGLQKATDGKHFLIEEKRKYELQAPSQEELEAWMSSLEQLTKLTASEMTVTVPKKIKMVDPTALLSIGGDVAIWPQKQVELKGTVGNWSLMGITDVLNLCGLGNRQKIDECYRSNMAECIVEKYIGCVSHNIVKLLEEDEHSTYFQENMKKYLGDGTYTIRFQFGDPEEREIKYALPGEEAQLYSHDWRYGGVELRVPEKIVMVTVPHRKFGCNHYDVGYSIKAVLADYFYQQVSKERAEYLQKTVATLQLENLYKRVNEHVAAVLGDGWSLAFTLEKLIQHVAKEFRVKIRLSDGKDAAGVDNPVHAILMDIFDEGLLKHLEELKGSGKEGLSTGVRDYDYKFKSLTKALEHCPKKLSIWLTSQQDEVLEILSGLEYGHFEVVDMKEFSALALCLDPTVLGSVKCKNIRFDKIMHAYVIRHDPGLWNLAEHRVHHVQMERRAQEEENRRRKEEDRRHRELVRALRGK